MNVCDSCRNVFSFTHELVVMPAAVSIHDSSVLRGFLFSVCLHRRVLSRAPTNDKSNHRTPDGRPTIPRSIPVAFTHAARRSVSDPRRDASGRFGAEV